MNADPSSYYHTLLAKAQAVSPDLMGELEHLFQMLLLALVAKQKHVIVRTLDEDIPRICRLAVNVSNRKTIVGLCDGERRDRARGLVFVVRGWKYLDTRFFLWLH